MSTTATPAVPTVSVSTEIKTFFSKLGKELEVIGTDALKDIALIQKDTSTLEPIVLATIQAMFPNVTIPSATISKIVTTALGLGTTVASALQAEGLNPTLDQTAAIGVATVIHSLKAAPTATK
jgi:hypothetical protein